MTKQNKEITNNPHPLKKKKESDKWKLQNYKVSGGDASQSKNEKVSNKNNNNKKKN